MATTVQVPLEEYLRTTYEDPEPEYVRGELRERPMPNFQHGEIITLLAAAFVPLRKEHRLFTSADVRLRLSRQLVYLADFVVYAGERPLEAYPSHPPLVAVEVLSPDNAMTAMLEKLRGYEQWGAKRVWVVDPPVRALFEFTGGDLRRIAAFELPEYNLRITAADLF